MKKIISLISLLLVGCTVNPIVTTYSSQSSKNSDTTNDTSSSSTLITNSSVNNIYTNDYAYIYDFENDYSIDYFTSSNGLVTFGSLGEGNAEIGPNEYVDFADYGITNLVAGDTISITCEGGMWIAAIQGGYACVEKIHSIEYYPSTIYEVNLIKNIIDDDQIQIGFEDSLMDSLENKYVISKDEEGNIIKKELSEYDDNTTLYYSFNQKMDNPHKYSFIYDYKVR